MDILPKMRINLAKASRYEKKGTFNSRYELAIVFLVT
jgi:hypothetical protein